MAAPSLHLIKLSVGSESVKSLQEWQVQRQRENRAAGRDDRPCHVTRMWPRRADELLAGGSIYWVIKGIAQARQRIAGLEPRTGNDGIRRCAIILEPKLIRTAPQPRRAFQGWRYLDPSEAPPDLAEGDRSDLPPALLAALSSVGVR